MSTFTIVHVVPCWWSVITANPAIHLDLPGSSNGFEKIKWPVAPGASAMAT